MSSFAGLATLRVVVMFAVGMAAATVGHAAVSPHSPVVVLAARYVRHLDGSLRALFLPEIGWCVVVCQAIACVAVMAIQVAAGLPTGWALLLAIAAGPEIYLRRARRHRIARLEAQVDGFVVALANSLKTIPNPAAALLATVAVLQDPTRQEIEQVLREIRVGSTVEQAIIAMSERIRSRWLDVALSAVLIGLKIGGNLPTVLERTAATIREMNRLLGVVRTKTGEGRMQLWVLAGFPLLVGLAFDFVQPGYFDPLRESLLGQVAVGIAALSWIASLLVARKILTVDL